MLLPRATMERIGWITSVMGRKQTGLRCYAPDADCCSSLRAMKDRLLSLAEERFGRRPEGIVDLAADGSTRQYFRLVWEGERTVIGALGPDHDENRAFLAFAKAFRATGLPVPEIYAEDQEEGAWLLEDLGDTTLFAAVSNARAANGSDEFPAEIVP